ncbi:thymocyte nuclear protein 1 [Plakobranchus ocellatus]|uniref:Thymocyte nuclear protein 1 n=1 Tax=Plakobranchus ocellatus TaxID=259542 RepID=A0AAV4C830_9GAST|nr:thymocyte nuclear protein 1 [Plakobranchus ocellatus]
MPPKRKAQDGNVNIQSRATKRNKTNDKQPESSQKAQKQHPKKTNEDKNQGNDVTPMYRHWLLKSEPNSRLENGVDMKFSFDDLKKSPSQTSCWDGVRNYQARNFLRDQMKMGHEAFFYHSNCKEPGIIGLCKVVKESYPDYTQFDPKDPHYDHTSTKDNPKWFMVDVKYVRPLQRFISLAELKKAHQDHVRNGGPLCNLALFTKARLSVQPLTQEEWDFILKMEQRDGK